MIRNTSQSNIQIQKIVIVGVEHLWDQDASITSAPAAGRFYVYEKLSVLLQQTKLYL